MADTAPVEVHDAPPVLSKAEHHAAGLDALGDAASHFLQAAPGAAADDATDDATADDTPGPPDTGGDDSQRGAGRLTALSATRRTGFPGGTGAQRSMDAMRGAR